MPDNPDVGGNSPDGAGGNTNSPVSAGATPAVADAVTIAKLVGEAISEQLKPIKGDISGLYSRQDKDRNSLREFMEEYKKQQGKGLTEDQAIEAAQSEISKRAEAENERKMLKEIHSKLFGSPSAPAAGNGANGASEAAKVIEELQLDANSADVIAILKEGYSPEKQELELRRMASRPRTQPSTSAVPASNTDPSPIKPDRDAIAAEISQLVRTPSAPGAFKRIAELQEALKKL